MKLLSQVKNTDNEYDFSHLLYYGDYACANFLSMYPSKCRILQNNEYPVELKKEFGISDARLFHHFMISAGLLEPSSIEERLAGCTLEQIVDLAQKIGLPESGTKEEILQRLSLNADVDQIAKFIPQEDVYSLSTKGKEFLDAKKDLLTLYAKKDLYHVNYNEYAAVSSKNPAMTFEEILWQIMSDRFQQYAKDTEYDKVQNEYLNMYTLLKDQGKNGEALNALLTYFYMDLNVFADTYEYIEQYKRSSLTVPEFLAAKPVPQFQMDSCIVEQINALKDCFQPKIAESISKKNISYYVDSAAFLAILNQIFAQTFSIEDTTKMINERIPKVLDHILRAEKK